MKYEPDPFVIRTVNESESVNAKANALFDMWSHVNCQYNRPKFLINMSYVPAHLECFLTMVDGATYYPKIYIFYQIFK